MKNRITLLFALLLMSLQAFAQNGKIEGTATDENGDPVVGAIIEAYNSGVKRGGAVTDFDGKYTISLAQGKYEILGRYSSYKAIRITDVIVKKNEASKVDLNFNPNSLEEVTVIKHQKPLISEKGKVNTNFDAADIKNAPTRDLTKLVETSAGMVNNGRSGNINAAGASGGNTITMLDGIMIRKDNTQYYNPSLEEYKKVAENDFMNVQASPLSTMSIDVDRASYANVRRFIQSGQLPPADAVRVEEMINYFSYNYPAPTNDDPIAITTTLTDCPWKKDHKLLKIGMQAKKIRYEKLPASNLVFLIDVSGSMYSQDKLPLLVSSMKLLVNNLRNEDRVSIVTYAGNAGLVLPSTPGSKKEKINEALERLTAGGSTAGAEGILTAYKVAQENFIRGGNNRIILATDGDFNVGISADNELETLITKEREKGIFLSCLGFGTGNFKDAKMEMLADKGNGNYSYIDNIDEGKKTLVNEFGGTLFTVAKDVKAQIEFNPNKVQSYRLVGYENRMLNAEDFKDDKKDAGELGAGHTVTFIYEIIPSGIKDKNVRPVNDLKYRTIEEVMERDEFDNELATIKFRYKKPEGTRSTEMTHTVKNWTTSVESVNEDTRFAYSVALFGMILKNSKFKGDGTINDVLELAKNSKGEDEDGYRAEFIKLVKDAKDNISVSMR